MRFLLALFFSLASTVVLPLPANALDVAEGEVVLTVSGGIAATNNGETAQFDMAMLQALPETSFATSTLWTEGVKTFTGVALAEVLSELGVTEGTIRASAINDYTIEIPVDSVTAGAPIIAYALDGEPMSRRQKGPLWVVYPYDSDAEYRSEVIYSRSIWQLDRLEIVQ